MNETGLEITFRALARSSNRAALRLAIGALSSPFFAIRRAAVETLLRRRDADGHLALLERWKELGAALRGLAPLHRDGLLRTLDDRLPKLTGELRAAAIEAATFLGACELLPAVIRAATRGTTEDRNLAERAAVDLAGVLSREYAAPRPRLSQRALVVARHRAAAALRERVREALDRPDSPLFETYLILADDRAGLETALMRPDVPVRDPLLRAIRRTRNAAALARALDLFANSAAYKPIAEALMARRDPEFLEAVLRAVEAATSTELVSRLRTTGLLGWLNADEATLRAVPKRYGPLLVRLALRLTDHPPRMQELLEGFYKVGEPDVRREALRLARKLPARMTIDLLRLTRREQDPETLGEALVLMREKESPDLFSSAVAALVRPHSLVLDGLRRAFPELTYEALARRMEGMQAEDLRPVGRAIFALRPESVERLLDGLRDSDRSIQIKAIRLARGIGPAPEIEPTLISLARNGDRQTREHALEALAQQESERSADALADALSDDLPQIRDAAERLIAERVSRRPTTQIRLQARQLADFVETIAHGHVAERRVETQEATP